MKKSTIKFARLRNVELPSRGHKHDAGIDFFVPKFDKPFINDFKVKNPLLYETGSCPTYCGTIGAVGSESHIVMSAGGSNPTLKLDLSDTNNSLIKFDEDQGKSYIPLAPMDRVNIPSGVYCKMDEPGRALIAFNKSGVASKKGLVAGACVVDYEYQGEIHINVINTSSKTVRVYEGDKLIQFIEMPIFTSEIKEVKDPVELYPDGITQRGADGFGSTDKENKPLNS